MAVRFFLLIVLILLAPFAPATRAGEAENWRRLQSLPRERRVELSEALKQFDALPPDERAAIRKLDEQVSVLSTDDQARYRAVLRRYHLWVEGLPEEQRDLLSRAPLSERMALVAKFRRAEEAAGKRRLNTSLATQVMPCAGPAPLEAARVLHLWLALAPADRATVEKHPPGQFGPELRKLAGKYSLKPNPVQMPADFNEEKLIQELEAELRTRGEAPVPVKFVRDAAKAKKMQERDPEKGKNLEHMLNTRHRHHLAENYYFVKHPPEKVSPDNLLRFDASMPGWIKSAYNTLPPEEARRRLAVLYRLIFPFPEEMPRPKPPPNTPKSSPSRGSPAKRPASSQF
jgi:hypothetical protein